MNHLLLIDTLNICEANVSNWKYSTKKKCFKFDIVIRSGLNMKNAGNMPNMI